MEMVARDLIPNVANYKLKVNGFHLVATRRKIEKSKFRKKNDLLLQLFNKAFDESETKGLTDNNQINYINERMIALYKVNHSFDDLFEIEEYNGNFIDYIERKLKQKKINLILRKKRFKEKINLHSWSFFVTQTYDSAKFKTEEDFVKSYLTCLSHLATDYGWRYILVPERGKVTGRLHFHGVFYVPKGNMKGFMKESKYFSPIKHKMEKSMINSFFAVRFGRNDFQKIENSVAGISNYIAKYIGKTDAKIIYSRHIDNCIDIELKKEDISIGYKLSYCTKFIVFDDLFVGTFLNGDIKRGLKVVNATS